MSRKQLLYLILIKITRTKLIHVLGTKHLFAREM